MTHLYEIYTKNPYTRETGWAIKWVRSTADRIASFPNFDCIITVDDMTMCSAHSVGVEVIDY